MIPRKSNTCAAFQWVTADEGAADGRLSAAEVKRALVAGDYGEQLPDGLGEGDLTVGREVGGFEDARDAVGVRHWEGGTARGLVLSAPCILSGEVLGYRQQLALTGRRYGINRSNISLCRFWQAITTT